MSHLLLLGAGFSKNWGGLLASEVRADLAARLHRDPFLSNLLHRSDGFEETLGNLRLEYRNARTPESRIHLVTFQNALRATFDAMNAAFAERRELAFCNDIRFSVVRFLARFHAIFTLNQDLLLERLYAPPMPLARPDVWNSCYFPGMRPHGDWINDPGNVVWTPSGDFAPPHHSQPVFKLHGSTNWVEHYDGAQPQGDGILVMGDAKGGAIDASPVLSFYRDEYLRLLSQDGAKLMVIGYGFLDDHINNLICRARETNPFTMYLVHPSGRGHLRNINPTSRGAIYAPQPIEDIPIADFTNPLRNTFGGNDVLDHQRLCRFFEE